MTDNKQQLISRLPIFPFRGVRGLKYIMKINSYIPFLALSLGMMQASCTQGDEPQADTAPAPLSIGNVQLTDQTSVDTQADTRAATYTTYDPTKDGAAQYIGFFVKEDATAGYEACNNRRGSYDDVLKQWTANTGIWLNDHAADVAVYAPYDPLQPSDGTLRLTAATRNAAKPQDVWLNRFTATNAAPTVAKVQLNQLFTRFTISLTKDATFTPDATITGLTITGKEVHGSCIYSPFEASPYVGDGAKRFTPVVTAQTLKSTTDAATYDLLMIPVALTERIVFIFTVNGAPMKFSLRTDVFSGKKLEAGKNYQVAVKLKPGVLNVFSVTMEDWDQQPEIDAGTVVLP